MITYLDMTVTTDPGRGNRKAPRAIITAEMQRKAIESILGFGFTARTLQEALEKQGCGSEAYRGADRLIQKLRKAGVIHLTRGSKPVWNWA